VAEMSFLIPPAFAATDMLHRRTPLLHEVRATFGSFSTMIHTNDAAVAEAFIDESRKDRSAFATSENEWQIEIALDDSAADGSEFKHEPEVCCFGSSRSIRFANGSWFAHTPPSGDGVGFLWLATDADSRVMQFADFLRSVALFVFDEGLFVGLPEVLEVVA